MAVTKAEKEVLKRMKQGWQAVINARTFYVCFCRGSKIWVPRGRTGATVNSLMKKGYIDFEKKPGTIKGLVRVNAWDVKRERGGR